MNPGPRGWEDWQRYVQKEKQRLLHKSGKRVVEVDTAVHQPPAPQMEDLESHDEHDGIELSSPRRPPVPGVPREEALQVSDDLIGRTVKPFTVNDYRRIKPLTGSDLFDEATEDDEPPTASLVPEMVLGDLDDADDEIEDIKLQVVRSPEKILEEELELPKKQGGKKKKSRVDKTAGESPELSLFSDDISEHQAMSRQRLTRKTKLEREELIEKLLDPVISLEEAATLIGVCKTTVRRYTNRGELDCLRTPGQQRRFKLSQVLEFVKAREEEERTRQARNNRR